MMLEVLTMAYLIDNRPRRSQHRPRRATPSGVVVVHTAEARPTLTRPDDSAERVARFIRDRSDPGSYHELIDSDSYVHLVPWDREAFGDGTGSNPHALHISFATQAARWSQLPGWWVEGALTIAAERVAAYSRWLQANHGIVVPAKRITRAESEARQPGFISHGERDPGRRSDPGQHFPWSGFLDAYGSALAPTQEDDMTPEEREWLKSAVMDSRAAKEIAERLEELVARVFDRQIPEDTMRAHIRLLREVAETVGADRDT
jgi:hypothetical protein